MVTVLEIRDLDNNKYQLAVKNFVKSETRGYDTETVHKATRDTDGQKRKEGGMFVVGG